MVLLGEQVTQRGSPGRVTRAGSLGLLTRAGSPGLAGAALIAASMALLVVTKPDDKLDQVRHAESALQPTGMTSHDEDHYPGRDAVLLLEEGTL